MPTMPDLGGRPNPEQGTGPNYQNRIKRLKGRLDNPGANKQKLRSRIGDLRSQKYLAGQQGQPDPSLPFNAEYDTTVSGLARNRNVALQNNAYERQQTQANYGFDNPLANPYSKAALLQRSYDQFNKGAINGAAASGQLYSGSTQTGLDEGLFNFGQEYNAQQSAYQNDLRGLTDADLAANTEYNDGLQNAEAKRLADALSTDVAPGAAPDTPTSVKKWIKGTKKDIRQASKAGRDNKAEKLREKLKKLGVNYGR